MDFIKMALWPLHLQQKALVFRGLSIDNSKHNLKQDMGRAKFFIWIPHQHLVDYIKMSEFENTVRH